jgi:hypothetical protein
VTAATGLALLACGCGSSAGSDEGSDGVSSDVSDEAWVAAAETLCPVMWTWVTEVGDTFNGASLEMSGLPAAEQRRQRWFEMFDEIEGLDRQLLVDVEPLADDPVLSPLVADIETGITASLSTLDDLRDLLVDTPEVDEGPHQDRTSQLVIRVEKVIDVVKPELSDHDQDGRMIASFQQVPTCQHAVKDVDDGTPQYNS